MTTADPAEAVATSVVGKDSVLEGGTEGVGVGVSVFKSAFRLVAT